MWDLLFEQCFKVFKVEEVFMNLGLVFLQNLFFVRVLYIDEDKIFIGIGNDEV